MYAGALRRDRTLWPAYGYLAVTLLGEHAGSGLVRLFESVRRLRPVAQVSGTQPLS